MRKNISPLIGILMMIFAVLGSLYLGVWVMFVGGILDIVHEAAKIIAEKPYAAGTIGWGIVKILFASPISVFVGWVMFILGWGIYSHSPRVSRK